MNKMDKPQREDLRIILDSAREMGAYRAKKRGEMSDQDDMWRAIKQLNEVAKDVFGLAQAAYWKDEKHCGSEYEEERCKECEHWLVCLRIMNIQTKFSGR